MTSVILGKIRDFLRELTAFDRRRDDERAYVTWHVGDVSADGTITLALANPTTETNIDVEQLIVGSQFPGRYYIYDAFESGPSGGTANEIDNLFMDTGNGGNDDGQMTATRGVTFTASETHYGEILASGGSGGQTRGGRGKGPNPILEPGREIVVELQNDATEADPGSIAIVYTETPQ